MGASFPPDDEKIAAIRDALPATGAGIYFNTAHSGPLPRETAAAMADIAQYELTTGRAHGSMQDETLLRMDEARATVAAILTADIDEIALTHSTTDGLNIATWGVDWRPGDRAVTTNLEHPGGIGPLLVARERIGIDLAVVEIDQARDGELTVAAFDDAIRPGTRLVSVSHVAWSTGTLLPVARIAEIARARGALVVVDGAQAAGAIPVDPAALGADVYSLPGHKWLLGPEGIGAVWVRRESIERIARTFAGVWSLQPPEAGDPGMPWPTARRFETAGYHGPAIVGLARSCGWLSMYVGLDWIHARATRLAQEAADRLATIPGIELVTPRQRMATLVSFRIAGWPARQALDELGKRVFAIAQAFPALDCLRISLGFFNTEREVERFCAAVAEIAAHSPDTLPRLPALTILDEGYR